MSDGGAPQFVRSGSLPLYWLQPGSGAEALPPGYRAGYRPSPGAALPDPASLDDVWRDGGGTYVFVDATVDDATFLVQLDALLDATAPPGAVRLLWISNPAAPDWQSWQVQYLLARWSDSDSPIRWWVQRQGGFSVGAYTYLLEADTPLDQATPGNGPGWGIAAEATGASFSAPFGVYPAQPRSAWLPLDGGTLGCWRADISLPAGGDDNFSLLGVQLRYATLDADGNVLPVPMPVLQQGGDAVPLAVSLDPLNHTLPDRSRAEFVPSSSATPLRATLVTTLGYGTTLTPAPAQAGIPGARLVFNASPVLPDDPDPAYQDYYLAPDGAFTLAIDSGARAPISASAGMDQLTLGASGLEYVEVPPSGALARFEGGRPAFAATALAPEAAAHLPGAPSADPAPPPLDARATTAWLTVMPPRPDPNGYVYFAQPQQAPLYAPGSTLGKGFMDFVPLAAGRVGATPRGAGAGTLPATFPVGVYGALPPALAGPARAIEEAALAPSRRQAIAPASPSTAAAVADVTTAVTPQGLIGGLSGGRWATLQLAHLPGARQPDVILSRLSAGSDEPRLLRVLQSNQLFMVVANPDTFMQQASVRYQITEQQIEILLDGGRIKPEEAGELKQWFGPLYAVYPTEDDFTARFAKPLREDARKAVLDAAGLLKADLQGWTFQLSPRSWRDGDDRTVMLFKYCNRSLLELIADPSSWGWAEAAVPPGGSLATTQAQLQRIVAAARDAAPGTPEHRFYTDVVADPAWNGTVFLNAPVSLADFPPALQFVLAGLDTKRFFAHHVGFSLTPFELTGNGTTGITPRQTAAFGLIRYSDPADLVVSPDTGDFAFKTLSLSARFANAALADFATQVELLVARLFGDQVTKLDPERGNNLVLDGSFQHQNGAPTYAFTLRGSNLYRLARSMLQSVDVLGLQLQTSSGTPGATSVATDFVLTGNLRFSEVYPFDLFSYGAQDVVPEGTMPLDGYLRFGNLAVSMSFPLGNTKLQTFSVNEGRIGFDMANSVTRPGSLVNNFPLRLNGLVASPRPADPDVKGQRPEDLGYTSVAAPLQQSPLASPWYGLSFSVDLGTVGALAGSVGLSIGLLAAWAPGMRDDERPAFVGLHLPSGPNWPLQGVLRLSFRSFQFQVHEDSDGSREYMLRMRRFALSLLGWSFPPGSTDVLLFGNPTGNARAALGWYAAYSQEPKKPSTSAPALAGTASQRDRAEQRRLQSGRRRLPPPAGV